MLRNDFIWKALNGVHWKSTQFKVPSIESVLWGMSRGNLRVKEQSVSCMFAAMRSALWLVERLITWSMQDHCRCCAYLIRVLTAGQKKEDLENVPKIPLYVSRCCYPWKRIVTYPEWLLLLIMRILWMGHQLWSNVLLWYLIQQLLVRSGNVHHDAHCLLDKWPNHIYLPTVWASCQ